ncbi:PIR protein, putative [Plasmodium sp. gorilla clade G1]|nr:PIR protein, putative [Plasmodium sp. gorilla clade G1]
MKLNYINISLFSFSLNILSLSSELYNQRNHNLTLHDPSITSRRLCECILYAPTNYDNDPEMKDVMQDFDRQTSQRFHEFDKRMIKNRKKCKDQCDKDIQKIILKDKIEKELKEKLAKLETNIITEDLPTCECEKSLSHKMENTCLGCGGVLGSGIAPSVGLFGGVALNALRTTALKAAMQAAIADGAAEGAAAGHAAGAAEVIKLVFKYFGVKNIARKSLESIIDSKTYTNASDIALSVYKEYEMTCLKTIPGFGGDTSICPIIEKVGLTPGDSVEYVAGHGVSTQTSIKTTLEIIVSDAERVATSETIKVTASKTAALKETNMTAVEAGFNSYFTAINASIIAILIIVLVMVIIYLILRYRRKKKMKKKLQYIKLLKE